MKRAWLTYTERIVACVFWHHRVSLDPACTSGPIPGHVSWACTLESSAPLLFYEQETREKYCKMEHVQVINIFTGDGHLLLWGLVKLIKI